MKALLLTVLLLLGLSTPAWATNYYISPTGSDGANGTTTSTPWLTFSKAFGGTGMAGSPVGCGHTLNLMDGVYGDGTSTGKISLSNKVCTVGAPLTITAVNQRQARINDNGTGQAISLTGNTRYIIIDGLTANSTDNAASANGQPFNANNIHNVTVKNSLFYNPNRYANAHGMSFVDAFDSLSEDNEIYRAHRHCQLLFTSENMVSRRVYCNTREGGIGNQWSGVGEGGRLASFYPCKNCILENGIIEGTGSLIEMNATFGDSLQQTGGQVLGSIAMGPGHGDGMKLEGRTSSGLNYSHINTVIRDVVINQEWPGSGPSAATSGIRSLDGVNTTLDHITVLGYDTVLRGIMIEDQTGIGQDDANLSVTMTNIIAKDFSTEGFKVSDLAIVWTGDELYSYSNADDFNPNEPSNWTNTETTDPGLGTCLAWVPDAAAVKGAGTGGSDIGATILYRYENGTLTDTPLWDPTTGEFPHGALYTGVNDVAGESLFDVHERLNINTGGCDFPAGYAGGSGGEPANPATMVTSEGTTGTTHNHTVPANTDFLLQCIVLHDTSGNVGDVAAASSGGEALTLIATQVNTPNNSRRASLYQRTAPTSGVRSQVVTTTGAVTGIRTTSIEAEGYSSIGSNATATGLSSTPTVTVVTNTGETIYDCLAGKKGVYLSSGEDQTLQRKDDVSTADLTSAISSQAGDDGGVMTHVMGGNNYWAEVAVSMLPTTPDPPVTNCTLTQVAGQVDSAFLVGGAVVHLGAVNAANVAVDVGTSFAVTLQTDATAAACATAGRKLYASYDGGTYAAVGDTMTNGLSFFGATADPNVVSGAISTNLSGVLTNVPGTTIHSASVNPMATMTQDDSLVNRWVLKLDPTAVGTHTFEFLEYTDAGVALDALNPATADAKITVTGTAPVISAPANLALAGPSSNTIVQLIWAPSTYATFAGYRVYRGTATGVYGATPIATITPASAAARHTPPTRYLDLTHVAATYFYVVTAFDLDGNESPVSNEVSITQTGFTARGAP